MIRLNQEAVNLALVLLVLAAGCIKETQPQPDVSPSFKPSAKPTQVKEAPLAQEALPKADSKGDYLGKTSHEKWIVVDYLPDEVNCRWSQEMPTAWYAPDAKLPTLDVGTWPVVRRFKANQTLQANITAAGFATLRDVSGRPWLKVSIGSNDQICLVRANSKYVQPVR